jgi:hypothetical protein
LYRTMFLIALALIFTRAQAGQLPPELAGCRVYKVWSFDGDTEGWVADHNVTSFTLSRGMLKFKTTGPDPWIVNSTFRKFDASKYRFLGIKMRSSVGGTNQIYFATTKSPTFSDRSLSMIPVPSDGKMHFYQIDLSKSPGWQGQVTSLRIDPANGSGEVGAELEIDWIAIYQVPARLAMGRPYCSTDEKGTFISTPITNTGGEASSANAKLVVGDVSIKLPVIKPYETRHFTLRPKPAREYRLVATGGKTTFFEATLVPRTTHVKIRPKSIANDLCSLTFYSGGAKLTSREIGTVGFFFPLATLAYYDASGVMRYVEFAPGTPVIEEFTATLSATRKLVGCNAFVRWTFAMPDTDTEGSFECELRVDKPLKVLRFEGPRLLVGEDSFGASKDAALFPGIEYLEKDEHSGAAWFTGTITGRRNVPHPYKITVPLMVVEGGGGVVGLTWDPLDEWAKGRKLVSAQFESPNKSAGARNHLMTLFAPSVPEYVVENTEFAARPYLLQPGQSIKIAGTFFTRGGQTVADAAQEYFVNRGLPEPPPIAGGVEATIDRCITGFTTTLYSPEKNGWKSHVGLNQDYAFAPDIAAVLLGESLRRGKPELLGGVKIDPKAQLTQYIGTTLDWFSPAANAHVESLLKKQSADGGFTYELDDNVKQKLAEFEKSSGVKAKDLGTIGKTNSGLTATSLQHILNQALRTGKQEFVDAAIKGLKKVNSFAVPRGAQVWEVHAHTPDILASALCTSANLNGYILTGDREYLDYAAYWASTGVPFVYSWVPPIGAVPSFVMHQDELGEGKNHLFSKPEEFYRDPARQINPGASIAVFGTSFYIVQWYGTPVQWCGMAWANAVQRLLKIEPDPILQRAADMVFASCTQQQCDKGFLAGVFPDSWSLETNTVNGAYIRPDSILSYAYSLIGEKMPHDVESQGFDVNGKHVIFNTYAIIENSKNEGNSFEARLKFYPDQYAYSCFVRADRPNRVLLNDAPLAESADLRSAESGFYYDEADKALHVKYRTQSATARVRVDW